MKRVFLTVACCFCAQMAGLEYEQLFENEQVIITNHSTQLVEAANRYVTFINKLSKGEEHDYFAAASTLVSPNCKKVFNGALVTSSCEQFVSDLLQVYKTHGSWHLTPVEIVPSSETNSVTIRLTVDIVALGKYTEMLLMKFDSHGLISEMNIVFTKVEDGYSFDKK